VTEAGAAVALAAHPSEALRLGLEFARAGRDLPEAGWLAPMIAERLEALRRGEPVEGFLWVGPSDEAVGIALASPVAETGITVHPYLADGFRNAAALGAFLDAMERQCRVRGVFEPIVGVLGPARDALLQARGFHRIVRADMVFPDPTAVPDVPDDDRFPLRPLTREDGPALAALMARAYSDTPDDRALFQRWRDPAEDARRNLEEMLGTGLGTWRSDASFGVPVPGGLAAATLVHDFHGPLISEVMTDPDWRRRGFARRLLARSVGAVRAAGLGAPRLVVTLGNRRALPLYRSFGFVENPEAQGAVWIRPPSGA